MGIPTSRTKRRATALSRRVEQIGTTCTLLTYEKLAELCRRDEETAEIDGYPSGGGNGRGSPGGHGDPTISAVVRRDDDQRKDPVHETLEQMAQCLRDATKLMRRADRLSTVILRTADARRGRETHLQSACTVTDCDSQPTGVGSDRLRRGLCPRCYMAFGRWKIDREPATDPGAERRAFEVERCEQLREAEQEEVEWRIQAITTMQEQGNLPPERKAV